MYENVEKVFLCRVSSCVWWAGVFTGDKDMNLIEILKRYAWLAGIRQAVKTGCDWRLLMEGHWRLVTELWKARSLFQISTFPITLCVGPLEWRPDLWKIQFPEENSGKSYVGGETRLTGWYVVPKKLKQEINAKCWTTWVIEFWGKEKNEKEDFKMNEKDDRFCNKRFFF